ncbi:MAG: KOW domain-containing RNA-binding protein [Clostridia bacterium]
MEKGTIVKSIAGRDKDTFLVVIDSDNKFVYLSDGKKRPLENLKQKKIFHVALTKSILPQESLLTNKKIKTALRLYKEHNTEVI